MSTGRALGWALVGLILGALFGFAGELFRRQPAAKVQQRYVAPEASESAEASQPPAGATPDANR